MSPISPLPSPVFPWHMAQSKPYNFLPLASDSGLGFTGFCWLAASGGILYSAGGVLGSWFWANIAAEKTSSGKKIRTLFNTATSEYGARLNAANIVRQRRKRRQ